MEKKQKPEEVKIKTQEIELVKIDYTQYVGKKEVISQVQIFLGEFGHYVKLTTSVIDVIGKDKKEPFEIVATRNFGLFKDVNGILGWSPDTKLGQFLKLKKCKTLEELKGKSVIVQVEHKEDKQFLTFV